MELCLGNFGHCPVLMFLLHIFTVYFIKPNIYYLLVVIATVINDYVFSTNISFLNRLKNSKKITRLRFFSVT